MASVIGDEFARRQQAWASWVRHYWRPRRSAARTAKRLSRVMGPPNGAALAGVVAVVPYYGERRLLDWFLAYYRRLGAGFFVFLDLGPKQDLQDWLASAADCAVWRPIGFMHPSQTLHALNFLRHLYAEGKWCLSVEPFDLLVFPKSETRHLRDLTDFVESEQRDHVAAVVVDAYGDRPAREMDVGGGPPPEELLPYFDRFGYQTLEPEANKVVPILGGVQRRALYGDEPRQAPPLNRIPLVKLTKQAYYTASTRQLVPFKLNTPHSDWHSTTTCCLLRYAMLGSEEALHVAKQAEGGQLAPDQTTTLYPGSEKLAAMTLKNQNSGRFASSQDLLACGLLNNGQWF